MEKEVRGGTVRGRRKGNQRKESNVSQRFTVSRGLRGDKTEKN